MGAISDVQIEQLVTAAGPPLTILIPGDGHQMLEQDPELFTRLIVERVEAGVAEPLVRGEPRRPSGRSPRAWRSAAGSVAKTLLATPEMQQGLEV